MPVSVAIVGAGPTGFYTAEALIKGEMDCTVDIIERLPAPFGLIRYGVAPDHQTTKNVTRNYGKTASAAQVRYFGNVDVGHDVSVDELREIYDAVVLTVGAPRDNPLTIPGCDKKGVVGSAEFVGWYNGHPDFCDIELNLDTKNVAVIGNGNVAIDIARVLVKTREEMAPSDIVDYALDAIQASPITDVYMFGRRGPIEAKFTNVELREMGKLENCMPVVDPAVLPDEVGELDNARDQRLKERNLATLKEFPLIDPTGKEKRVHFAFYHSPVEILGGEHVEGLRLEKTEVVDGRAVGTGEFVEIECGLVVPAIGYRADPLDGAPFDERNGIFVNEDGRIADGLYAGGWVKRGPTGVIGTNKPDGRAVADHIANDFPTGSKPGRPALEKLLAERKVRAISFDDWLKVDAAEVAGAREPSPRRKFVKVEEMLSVLGG